MPAKGVETFFSFISTALFSFVYNYHTITGKRLGTKLCLFLINLVSGGLCNPWDFRC
jgi:hypothetical protein